MHKIAIITTGYENYDQYGDSYGIIVNSITDWAEVSDEEFKCLKAMETQLGYHVIERPLNMDDFVKKTVADYLVYVQAEEKRRAEEKARREQAALNRKLKKDLKDKENKKELLKKLIDEVGLETVNSIIKK